MKCQTPAFQNRDSKGLTTLIVFSSLTLSSTAFFLISLLKRARSHSQNHNIICYRQAKTHGEFQIKLLKRGNIVTCYKAGF